MKFKTDAQCPRCKERILNAMNKLFPNSEWTLDLDNANKVLEEHGIPSGPDHAAKVIAALEATGFKGSWIEEE